MDNAPDKKVLSKAAYSQLAAAVDRLLREGEKAGRDADSGWARVYWEVGDRISAAGLTGKGHYGEGVLDQLAGDLEIKAQTLRRAVAFRRVYDRQMLYRTVQHLTWSHYRALIDVRDDAARRYYEDRAVKEGWSRDRMRAAIADREYDREVKGDEDAGVLTRPTDAEYVFRARVRRVIDGDTLDLDIRVGFKMVKEQEHIRLAKVNAPEIETKKGKEVAHYVRDRLAKARGVVVKTERADEYGRYVGHVFYSFEDDRPGAVYEKGVYLNDELLKKGMAERL